MDVKCVTPADRRVSSTTLTPKSKNRRADVSRNDNQNWTAARCHRILRQLESRLAILRKLVSEPECIRQQQKVQEQQKTKRSATTDGTETHRDAKRIRHTYGQRSRQAARSKKAEAKLQDQMTTRTLGTLRPILSSESPAKHHFSVPQRSADDDMAKRRDALRHSGRRTMRPANGAKPACPAILSDISADVEAMRASTTADVHRSYEAVFEWLVNMLQSTEATGKTPHPKSLLGLCLRRVPQCIEAIEEWDRQASEEDTPKTPPWHSSDVALDMYNQLESFGHSGIGWRPLKLMVRSHAVSILAKAVAAELLDRPFVTLLARTCLRLQCHQEAIKLVVACPWPQDLCAMPSTSLLSQASLKPLAGMLDFVQDERAQGAVFACLMAFAEHGRLPAAWLSSPPISHVWRPCLEALSGSDTCSEAVEFFVTSVATLGSNANHELESAQGATEHLLTNLISTVAAAAAAPETVTDAGLQEHFLAQPWSRRRIHVLDRCAADAREQNKGQRGVNCTLFLVALARYFALASHRKQGDETYREQLRRDRAALETLIAPGGARAQMQYRQTVQLACFIAQHRRRLSASAHSAPLTSNGARTSTTMTVEDSVSEVCGIMQDLDVPDWFAQGLQTDVAFLTAQSTKDLRDLAFAEKLPAVPRVTAHSSTGSVFSGWRWEEGISEWVLPTPASKKSVDRKTAKSRSEVQESSPVREANRALQPIALKPLDRNKAGRVAKQSMKWCSHTALAARSPGLARPAKRGSLLIKREAADTLKPSWLDEDEGSESSGSYDDNQGVIPGFRHGSAGGMSRVQYRQPRGRQVDDDKENWNAMGIVTTARCSDKLRQLARASGKSGAMSDVEPDSETQWLGTRRQRAKQERSSSIGPSTMLSSLERPRKQLASSLRKSTSCI